MNIAERNNLIKKELSKEFRKLKVKGGHGTAFGWVHVFIYVPKHEGKCEYDKYGVCEKCWEKGDLIRKRIYAILDKADLLREIDKYISDVDNSDQYKIVIDVEFEPNSIN